MFFSTAQFEAAADWFIERLPKRRTISSVPSNLNRVDKEKGMQAGSLSPLCREEAYGFGNINIQRGFLPNFQSKSFNFEEGAQTVEGVTEAQIENFKEIFVVAMCWISIRREKSIMKRTKDPMIDENYFPDTVIHLEMGIEALGALKVIAEKAKIAPDLFPKETTMLLRPNGLIHIYENYSATPTESINCALCENKDRVKFRKKG